MKKSAIELKNTTYELFIIGLSILSIANLLIYYLTKDPNVLTVVIAVDGLLSLIFIIDFTYRLFSAGSKAGYVFRQFGWADLLASIPFPDVKVLRLFRIVRTVYLMRHYGLRRLAQDFVVNRGGGTLLIVLFLIVVMLEWGSIAMLRAEQGSPEANIKTASDALWWGYVTITTVGYGDHFPTTNFGRVIGMLILTLGVGLFGVLTGFLANLFLTPPSEQFTPVETPLPGEDPVARLAEIQRLVAEQEKAQAELRTKLGEIMVLLRYESSKQGEKK